MQPPLACTVRACGAPLAPEGRALVCARGHSFDRARAGYVNLLQPQDRRSADPGDAHEVVEARARLEAAGIGHALLEAVRARLHTPPLHEDAVVVDLGCGTGAALAWLVPSLGECAIGIDLSTPAITHAARSWPGRTWLVANADRRLPLLDHRVDVVLALHARRNPAEAARVLTRAGRLIVAVPSPDDLVELRQAVLGAGRPVDRVPSLLAEHAPFFALREHVRVTDRRTVDREALAALLRTTYRGARRSEAPAVEALRSLEVTFSSDLCVFVPVPARAAETDATLTGGSVTPPAPPSAPRPSPAGRRSSAAAAGLRSAGARAASGSAPSRPGHPRPSQRDPGRQAARGGDERLAFRTMQHLARLSEDQGRADEAERWWRRALAQLERTTPEPNFQVGLAQADLGAHLLARGRLAEAEPLLRDGYALLEDRRRGPTLARLRVRDALVRVYEMTGRREDAARWRARAVE